MCQSCIAECFKCVLRRHDIRLACSDDAVPHHVLSTVAVEVPDGSMFMRRTLITCLIDP